MQGFNHIAGGVAFTGIFASFIDVNIFKKPEYLIVTVFFALLPDIDHTRSPVGKLFYPLARWLDRKYGHRTITHSLLFFVCLVAIMQGFEFLFLGSSTLTFIGAMAYFSHLIFDMCTRSGIPLFYPVTSARCVLPGNPNLRIASGDMKSETVIFFLFIGLTLTCMPLMSQGFWTTYNNAFATISHLEREYLTSKDVIAVELLSNGKRITADVVDVNSGDAVLFDKDFIKINKQDASIIALNHTGRTAEKARLEFDDISTDSLRSLLKGHVMELKCVSTYPVRYTLDGERFEKSSLDIAYKSGFDFSPVEVDTRPIIAKIEGNKAEIKKLTAEYNLALSEIKALSDRIHYLESNLATFSAYEQGKAIDELKKLSEKKASAKFPTLNVAHLQSENQLLTESLNKQHLFTGYIILWKQ
jgi:inner membrane protein